MQKSTECPKNWNYYNMAGFLGKKYKVPINTQVE